MNVGVRITAKKAMLGKTWKLFFVSLLALVLRLLLISAGALIVYMLSTPQVQEYISSLSGSLAVSYLIYLAFSVLILFFLQTAAGIKLGESEYYGICVSGGKARLKIIFYHCLPRRALKALTLYVTIWIFKLIWLVTMLIPSAAIAAAAVIMYFDTGLSVKVLAVLCVSAAVLLITGLLCWYSSIQKYVFAPYISAKSRGFSPRTAIRRSIAVFDRCALSPMGIKLGLVIPVLMCVLAFPAIYVLPYSRMSIAALFKESKRNATLITCSSDEKPIVIHIKHSYN